MVTVSKGWKLYWAFSTVTSRPNRLLSKGLQNVVMSLKPTSALLSWVTQVSRRLVSMRKCSRCSGSAVAYQL
ncbi:hypothetical protein D3C80_2208310 [compost metagenome]